MNLSIPSLIWVLSMTGLKILPSKKQHIYITLRCLNWHQLIILEKIIMHTVHYGKLGKWNKNLTIVL